MSPRLRSPLPRRRALWPVLSAWVALPVLVGPALADALSDRSRAVQVVCSSIGWAAWGITLVGVLVPRTVTLTLLRMAAPGAVAVAAWAAVETERTAWGVVGVAAAAMALLAAVAPGVADAFVDGSSYGPEDRVALRVPPAVLVGPALVTWIAAAAAVTAGPLLLAAGRWWVGSVALVAGVPVFVTAFGRLHVLSRRWLVFVPAGIVVHDPLHLTEPVLIQRHLVERVGPAAVDVHALDTTGGALGLVIELRCSRPLSVGVRHGRGETEVEAVDSLLVTPTRPASTLELASAHRLPVT